MDLVCVGNCGGVWAGPSSTPPACTFCSLFSREVVGEERVGEEKKKRRSEKEEWAGEEEGVI